MRRILLWIDDPIHFGIAKSYQEKYVAKLFAIFDVSHKQKNFFSNQKFVSFEKTWFFRNQIANSKEKLDMDYLQNFEKRTKINLWSIIYAERNFYRFNEFHDFKYEELLDIAQNQCKFFDNVLSEIKPEYLFIHITDLFSNLLLSEICTSKSINVLMLSPSRFGFKTMISNEFDKFDSFRKVFQTNRFRSLKELKDYEKKFSSYNQGQEIYESDYSINALKRISRYVELLQATRESDFKKFYGNYGKSRLKILTKRMPIKTKLLIKRRESFLNKNSLQKIDKKIPFVYFPLHIEPERSLSVGAPFYTNQIEVITHIAKSLPVGYKLFVKEHPVMKIRNWREESFYKNILALPNVELIHPFVDPEKLLKNCSLVITITGTSGIEAAFYEKPCIVFSDVSYKDLPFISRIKNIEELPNVIRTMIENNYDFSKVNEYVNLVDNHSFDFDLTALYNSARKQFYHGGILSDLVDIPTTKMDSFLKSHKNDFDKIASEHQKIIEEYEKN